MAEPLTLPVGFRIVSASSDRKDDGIMLPPVPAKGGNNGSPPSNGTAYTRFIESNPVTSGLVGIGAGLTKAATGVIQTGAQLIGADDVANAAGRVTQDINRDVDNLGTSGAVGEFLGEVAPYAALPAAAPTLIGRTALGAAGGALAGGLQAQETPDIDQRRSGYVTGGMIGAVAPAALQGAGRALSATGRAVGTTVSGIKNVAVGRSADQVFQDVISRSSKSPEVLRQELAQGTISNIADIAGDEVAGLTRAVGKTEGGRNIISEALQGRSLDAVKRVSNDLSKSVSNVDAYFGSLDDLAKARAKIAEPMYANAYKQGENITNPNLDKFLKDRRIIDAIVESKKDYGVRLEALPNSLEALDGAKKVLDDRIGVAVRAGEGEKVRALSQFKNQFLKVLDESVPEYSKTRQVFSGFTRLKQAQETGLEFTRQTPEQLRRTLKDMTSDQREAFRIGVRENLQNTVNSTSDGADPAKRIFGNTRKREQLEAVFGAGKHFQDFSKRMSEEIRAANTKLRVLGGSRTDLNLSGSEELSSLIGQVANQGIKGTVLNRVVESIGNKIANNYYGISKQNAEEIARALVDRDSGIEALERIISKQPSSQSSIVREAVEGVRSFSVRNANPAIPSSAATMERSQNSQAGFVQSVNNPLMVAGMGAAAAGASLAIPDGFRIIDSAGSNNEPNLPPLLLPVSVSDTTIRSEEGYEPRAYRDTMDKTTVGYGFNLDQPNAVQIWSRAGVNQDINRIRDGQDVLTEDNAEKLFNETHTAAQRAARNIVRDYDSLGENQQAALTSLAFQLGGKGLRGFTNTLKNLDDGNAKAVENSLLNSLYARQTPARAKRTALMLAYNLSPSEAEDKLLSSGRITDRELKFINRSV